MLKPRRFGAYAHAAALLGGLFRRVRLVRLVGLVGLAGLAGCPATANEVQPPPYDFYFPTGLAVSLDADERYLFVISANSDLRYGAGAMHVVDLQRVDEIAAEWNGGVNPTSGSEPNCDPVVGRPRVLACRTSASPGSMTPSPSGIILVDGVSQIGNFGVNIALEKLDNGTTRMFSTVRGDPSITWADFSVDGNGGHLDCGGTETFRRCDEAHRLVRVFGDPNLVGGNLGSEPFGISVDGINKRGYATDLTSGAVSLILAPTSGDPPIFQSITRAGALWNLSTLDATLGAVGVATRNPFDSQHPLVYVTSRSEARVSIVHAVDQAGGDPSRPGAALVRTGSFFYDGLAVGGDSGDARNLVFETGDPTNPSDPKHGSRAFIISRTPPSLQIFDTSLDAQGSPRNIPIRIVEICSQPANLAVTDFGEGLRVVVPCFGTGQLWVLDPETGELIAVEDSGRGPSGVAVSAKRGKIYVGNYAEDTITVIDAKPGSPTQNRAVLRLGQFRIAVGTM